MQSLTIRNFGPIRDSQLEVKDFMVFTGKQASGKNTVAKTIFFFKNVPVLLDTVIRESQIRTFQPKDEIESSLIYRFMKSIRMNFLRTFGSAAEMDSDMYLEYCYTDDVTIGISLGDDPPAQDYIRIGFSDKLNGFLLDIETNKDEPKEIFQEKIKKMFDQSADIVYIPAGRSILTLMSN